MADLYDVADIIDKTLIAAKDLDVYDLPNGNIIGSVSKNNPAGLVYSYVLDSNNNLWWQFDSNQTALQNTVGQYYIKNAPGSFDVTALRQQGVITAYEKVQQQKEANKSLIENIKGIVLASVATITGGMVLKGIIEQKKK